MTGLTEPTTVIRPASHLHAGLRRPLHGFTLIELLVVIGIVALLISILLPTLSMARQAGRSTACLSNVRQVGTLINVYLVNSDGIMPTMTNREFTSQALPVMDTVLIRPGESNAILECPADETGVFAQSGSSYFWNFTVNGQRVERLMSIVGGSQPERVPLAADKEGWHPNLRDKVNVLYADGHAENQIEFATSLP